MGIICRRAFPVALEDTEASPHDPGEPVIPVPGRQSRKNLVRSDGLIPRPGPLIGAKPLQCRCVDTRRTIPLLRLSKGGRQSEMCLGEIGLALDDLFEGGDGPVQVSLGFENDSEAVGYRGVLGVKAHDLLIRGDGFRQVPASQQQFCERINRCPAVFAVQSNCLAVRTLGPVQVSFGLQGHAEVEVGIAILGVELDGLPALGDGLVNMALFSQRDTEVVVGQGEFRVE